MLALCRNTYQNLNIFAVYDACFKRNTFFEGGGMHSPFKFFIGSKYQLITPGFQQYWSKSTFFIYIIPEYLTSKNFKKPWSWWKSPFLTFWRRSTVLATENSGNVVSGLNQIGYQIYSLSLKTQSCRGKTICHFKVCLRILRVSTS